MRRKLDGGISSVSLFILLLIEIGENQEELDLRFCYQQRVG